MISKTRKTLNSILYAGAFTAASLFPSCEKEDTTPPKIKFISPNKGEIFYENRVLPIQWEIEDENGDFNGASLYVNGGVEFPIPKSGSINWYGKNGDNKIIIIAKDLNSNISKDSTECYVWSSLIKGNKLKYLK